MRRQPVWTAGVPVLGICYGMQTMAAQLGGAVENGLTREFGYAEVRARGHGRLLDGIQDRTGTDGHGLLDVWMSHGDKVIALPPGFTLMASNEATPIAAMMDESRRFYAVQFHPEVTHTRQGKAILQRFVRDICGCPGDWTMPAYVDEAIAKIRAQVGDDEVILGLSGGVDSSVAAALIHRAIGDAADLHIRRHRAAARRRGRAGDGRRSPSTSACASTWSMRAKPSCARSRRHRSRAETQDHRPRVRARVPGGSRQAPTGGIAAKWLAQGTIYPGRDRIRRREDQARRIRSSRITTSAACPKRCI